MTRPDKGLGRLVCPLSLVNNVRFACSSQQWLELVSKRVRSTVVGEIPVGSWADQGGDEEEDAAVSMDSPNGDGDGNGYKINRPRGENANSPPGLGLLVESSRNGTTAPIVEKGGGSDIDPSVLDGAATGTTRNAGGRGGDGVGSEAAASRAADGGKVEAALRQRLLAAMGKSKPRSH